MCLLSWKRRLRFKEEMWVWEWCMAVGGTAASHSAAEEEKRLIVSTFWGTLFFQVWQRCIKTQGSGLQTLCFSRWWPARAPLLLLSCLLPLPPPFLGLQQVPAVPVEHPWAGPLTDSARTAFWIRVTHGSEKLLQPCCDCVGSLLSELSVSTVTHYHHLLFSY